MSSRRAPRRAKSADLDLFGEASAPLEAAPPEVVSEYVVDDTAYPGASASSPVTVSVLTQTARDVLEGAFIPLWVRGEVTDFKAHRNGHWYFCLRDRSAQIRCVVWSRDQRGIPAPPDDGMQVVALGRLTVYPTRGEMQFTITHIEAEGDGLRRKALEATRKRLEADGLLAIDRKRALPRYPRVIAVITSPDGAALHDIVAVTKKRASDVRLVLVPAKVQGDGASLELRRALDRVNRWGEADVVIIGRGGGAREDLWAFNDEKLARAVAACSVPTISAVGHEVDITICDLVADYRAPTPSAAAEAATRSRGELASELRKLSLRMSGAARSQLRHRADNLRHLGRDVVDAGSTVVAKRRASMESVAGRLHALSPVATLARGYAVARGASGQTLSATNDFAAGDAFDLIVKDGVVPARVRRADEEGKAS